MDCFRLCVFAPGQHIIREGELGSDAFLIKEGECSLESSKSPLNAGPVKSEDEGMPKKTVDTLLRPQRGFFSDTINRLQFGILQKNQWAGEDRLIKETTEPFNYSVVALSRVVTYSISKHDAEKKLPLELKKFLKNLMAERSRWIEERTKVLASTTEAVSQMDPSCEKYDERLNEVLKKYPAALPHALKSIRKLQLITKMRENSKIHYSASVEKRLKLSTSQNSQLALPDRSASIPNLTASPAGSSCPHRATEFELPSFSATPRFKMYNASSMSRIVLNHSLVPTMYREGSKRHMSRLAKIGLASVLDSQGKSKASYFAIGARQIALQQEELEELKPTTPNPYFVLNRQSAGTNHHA